MRAFVAVGLGVEANQRFADLQSQLRAQIPGVSWARTGGVHITLVFFEDLPEASIADVGDAMRAAAVSPPPRLRPKGLGSFPNDRRPRVLWCGVEDEDRRLTNVRVALSAALRHKEIPLDDKRFSPHCTLGRARHGLSPGAIERWQKIASQPFTSDWWTAGELILFESRGGYREILAVAL